MAFDFESILSSKLDRALRKNAADVARASGDRRLVVRNLKDVTNLLDASDELRRMLENTEKYKKTIEELHNKVRRFPVVNVVAPGCGSPPVSEIVEIIINSAIEDLRDVPTVVSPSGEIPLTTPGVLSKVVDDLIIQPGTSPQAISANSARVTQALAGGHNFDPSCPDNVILEWFLSSRRGPAEEGEEGEEGEGANDGLLLSQAFMERGDERIPVYKELSFDPLNPDSYLYLSRSIPGGVDFAQSERSAMRARRSLPGSAGGSGGAVPEAARQMRDNQLATDSFYKRVSRRLNAALGVGRQGVDTPMFIMGLPDSEDERRAAVESAEAEIRQGVRHLWLKRDAGGDEPPLANPGLFPSWFKSQLPPSFWETTDEKKKRKIFNETVQEVVARDARIGGLVSRGNLFDSVKQPPAPRSPRKSNEDYIADTIISTRSSEWDEKKKKEARDWGAECVVNRAIAQQRNLIRNIYVGEEIKNQRITFNATEGQGTWKMAVRAGVLMESYGRATGAANFESMQASLPGSVPVVEVTLPSSEKITISGLLQVSGQTSAAASVATGPDAPISMEIMNVRTSGGRRIYGLESGNYQCTVRFTNPLVVNEYSVSSEEVVREQTRLGIVPNRGPLPSWSPEPMDWRRTASAGGHPNNAYNLSRAKAERERCRRMFNEKKKTDPSHVGAYSAAIAILDDEISEIEDCLKWVADNGTPSMKKTLPDMSQSVLRYAHDDPFAFNAEASRRLRQAGIGGVYSDAVNEDVLRNFLPEEEGEKAIAIIESLRAEWGMSRKTPSPAPASAESRVKKMASVVVIRGADNLGGPGSQNGVFQRAATPEIEESEGDPSLRMPRSSLGVTPTFTEAVNRYLAAAKMSKSSQCVIILTNEGISSEAFHASGFAQVFIDAHLMSSEEAEQYIEMFTKDELLAAGHDKLFRVPSKIKEDLIRASSGVSKLSTAGVGSKDFLQQEVTKVCRSYLNNPDAFHDVSGTVSAQVSADCFGWMQHSPTWSDLGFKSTVGAIGMAEYQKKHGSEWETFFKDKFSSRVAEMGRCRQFKQGLQGLLDGGHAIVSLTPQGMVVPSSNTDSQAMIVPIRDGHRPPLEMSSYWNRVMGITPGVISRSIPDEQALHLESQMNARINEQDSNVSVIKSSIPHLIWLYGFPGTGKTIFGDVMATELGCVRRLALLQNIFLGSSKASFRGGSETRLRNFIEALRNARDSVIVIDEAHKFFMGESDYEKDYVRTVTAGLQSALNDDKPYYVRNNTWIVFTSNASPDDMQARNADLAALFSRFADAKKEVELPATPDSMRSYLTGEGFINNMISEMCPDTTMGDFMKKLLKADRENDQDGKRSILALLESYAAEHSTGKDWFDTCIVRPGHGVNERLKELGINSNPDDVRDQRVADFISGWNSVPEIFRDMGYGVKEKFWTGDQETKRLEEREFNPLDAIVEMLVEKMLWRQPGQAVGAAAPPRASFRDLNAFIRTALERHQSFLEGKSSGIPLNHRTFMAAVKNQNWNKRPFEGRPPDEAVQALIDAETQKLASEGLPMETDGYGALSNIVYDRLGWPQTWLMTRKEFSSHVDVLHKGLRSSSMVLPGISDKRIASVANRLVLVLRVGNGELETQLVKAAAATQEMEVDVHNLVSGLMIQRKHFIDLTYAPYKQVVNSVQGKTDEASARTVAAAGAAYSRGVESAVESLGLVCDFASPSHAGNKLNDRWDVHDSVKAMYREIVDLERSYKTMRVAPPETVEDINAWASTEYDKIESESLDSRKAVEESLVDEQAIVDSMKRRETSSGIDVTDLRKKMMVALSIKNPEEIRKLRETFKAMVREQTLKREAPAEAEVQPEVPPVEPPVGDLVLDPDPAIPQPSTPLPAPQPTPAEAAPKGVQLKEAPKPPKPPETVVKPSPAAVEEKPKDEKKRPRVPPPPTWRLRSESSPEIQKKAQSARAIESLADMVERMAGIAYRNKLSMPAPSPTTSGPFTVFNIPGGTPT